MDLIDWLIERKGNLSLRAFARVLDTSAPRLSPLLSRQRLPNDADLGRIVRAFPDHCQEITALWESYRASWPDRTA